MIVKIDSAKTSNIPPGSSVPQSGVKKSFKDKARTTRLSMTYGSDFSACRQLLLPTNLLKIKIGENALLEHLKSSNVFPKYLK